MRYIFQKGDGNEFSRNIWLGSYPTLTTPMKIPSLKDQEDRRQGHLRSREWRSKKGDFLFCRDRHTSSG